MSQGFFSAYKRLSLFSLAFAVVVVVVVFVLFCFVFRFLRFSGKRVILHFRVMAVRDIKLKNRKGAKTERTWYPM